jgi:hypothetical protein
MDTVQAKREGVTVSLPLLAHRAFDKSHRDNGLGR